MTSIPAKCKFCGVNLVLEFDEGYAELGDPMKLVGYAACDRCADYRSTKRRLMEVIGKATWNSTLLSPKDAAGREAIRQLLIGATHKLAQLVTAHFRLTSMVWDEEFATILMDKPSLWHKAVEVYISSTVKEFKPRGVKPVLPQPRVEYATHPDA